MMPTVNLYLDRMNPVEPVRVADVYAATQDRASSYTAAAAKIGLTMREYTEFREALLDGGAIYVRLPQRIDAMAGVHRNGHVYALRNVVVPAGTMGWTVNLADGTQVIVPQICSNLSMNRSRRIAHIASPHKQQAKRVASARYVRVEPIVVHETPVIFTAPAIVAPASVGGGDSVYAGTAPAAAPVVSAGRSALPFLGLLAPAVAAFTNHGGSASSIPVTIAPCSAGSNSMGVCRP